jgi:hypothetical protein
MPPTVLDPGSSSPPQAGPKPQIQTAPAGAGRWFHVGGADVVFLFLAVAIGQTARQGMLDDPGLGWHLRNIDAMLTEGGWLHTDLFTEPFAEGPRPWYSNQWLGELPLWLGERWAGLEGVAAVTALILAFTLRCLYCMLLRDGLPWPAALVWTALAAMGTSCSWTARPNVFTLLFVLLTARVLVLFHEGRCSGRFTLWLWPLFTLWANMHGGFVAGFTLLALALGVEVMLACAAPEGQGGVQARARALHLLVLSAGALLATLVNPYGPGLYRWVFQLLGEPFFMDLHQEWKSPDFHGKGALRFELLMVLLPGILAVSKRRPSLVELAFVLAWLHLALTGFRYVPIWVLLVVPVLARCSTAIPWLRQAVRRLRTAGNSLDLFTSSAKAAPWLGSAAAALTLLAVARGMEGHFVRHQPAILPVQALNRFLALQAEWAHQHGRPARVFHSYDWGGYLTWHGWPAVHNWIDDRNEVQGKQHIEDYFSILETEPGWQDRLARDRIDLICIQANAPLTFRLAESRDWRTAYRDDFAVIFERAPPLNGSCGPRNPVAPASPAVPTCRE